MTSTVRSVAVFLLVAAVSSPAQTPPDLRGMYLYSNDVAAISAGTAQALTASLNVTGIDGFDLVIGWYAIEPAIGQYQWATLDQWMNLAVSLGKKVNLIVMAGGSTPPWMYTAAPSGAGVPLLNFTISPHGGSTGQCQAVSMAAPWNPSYLSQWDSMLVNLSAHLKAAGTYNAVTLLRLTGINRSTEELRLPAETPQSTGLACVSDAIATWQQAGYRPSLLLEAWDSLTNSFQKSFPDKSFSVSIIPNDPFPRIDENGSIIVGTPPDQNLPLMQLASLKFPGRLVVQFDFLMPGEAASPAVISYAQSLNTMVAFQTNEYFGSTGQGAACSEPASNPTPCTSTTYLQLLETGIYPLGQNVNLRSQYIEVFHGNTTAFPGDIQQAHVELFLNPLPAGGQTSPASGGSGSLSLTFPSNYSWTASSGASWITITGGGSGTGSGTLNYQVDANPGAARSSAITVAGFSFVIQQQAASITGLSLLGSMPHIAAEEHWNTTFTLVNKAGVIQQTRLNLYSDPAGNPLSLPLSFLQQPYWNGALLGTSTDNTLPAYGSLIVEAAGPSTAPVQIGSAQVSATGPVDGFAIFHLIPNAQEAVVPLETRNASSYLLSFDNTGGVVLAVAVENVSPQAANIPVVIRDGTGAIISAPGTSLALAGNGHTSFVSSTQYPVTANQRGTIEFDTPPGGKISVLGIRTTPLGTGTTLTTIPALANVGQTGGSIAHIAAANGWQTTFVLVNTGTSAAPAHLAFYDDTGNALPLSLSFPQGGTNASLSSVDQTLAGGATLLVQASGALTDPVVTGSAQLTSAGKVSGFVIFRYNPNGQEAVVPLESRNANAYVLAFDNTSGTATGIAINSVSTAIASIPLVIRDDTGSVIATDTLNLRPNGHMAFTLGTQKYPLTANLRGTIEFANPLGGNIGVLGIRTPLAHTFTTLPALAK